MSKEEITICDVCEREESSSKNLRIKQKAGLFHRTKIDICEDCLGLIRDLNRSDWHVSESLKQISKWYIAMCGADQDEFFKVLKRTAKAIDRYDDNHPEIYKALKRKSHVRQGE